MLPSGPGWGRGEHTLAALGEQKMWPVCKEGSAALSKVRGACGLSPELGVGRGEPFLRGGSLNHRLLRRNRCPARARGPGCTGSRRFVAARGAFFLQSHQGPGALGTRRVPGC